MQGAIPGQDFHIVITASDVSADNNRFASKLAELCDRGRPLKIPIKTGMGRNVVTEYVAEGMTIPPADIVIMATTTLEQTIASINLDIEQAAQAQPEFAQILHLGRAAALAQLEREQTYLQRLQERHATVVTVQLANLEQTATHDAAAPAVEIQLGDYSVRLAVPGVGVTLADDLLRAIQAQSGRVISNVLILENVLVTLRAQPPAAIAREQQRQRASSLAATRFPDWRLLEGKLEPDQEPPDSWWISLADSVLETTKVEGGGDFANKLQVLLSKHCVAAELGDRERLIATQVVAGDGEEREYEKTKILFYLTGSGVAERDWNGVCVGDVGHKLAEANAKNRPVVWLQCQAGERLGVQAVEQLNDDYPIFTVTIPGPGAEVHPAEVLTMLHTILSDERVAPTLAGQRSGRWALPLPGGNRGRGRGRRDSAPAVMRPLSQSAPLDVVIRVNTPEFASELKCAEGREEKVEVTQVHADASAPCDVYVHKVSSPEQIQSMGEEVQGLTEIKNGLGNTPVVLVAYQVGDRAGAQVESVTTQLSVSDNFPMGYHQFVVTFPGEPTPAQLNHMLQTILQDKRLDTVLRQNKAQLQTPVSERRGPRGRLHSFGTPGGSAQSDSRLLANGTPDSGRRGGGLMRAATAAMFGERPSGRKSDAGPAAAASHSGLSPMWQSPSANGGLRTSRSEQDLAALQEAAQYPTIRLSLVATRTTMQIANNLQGRLRLQHGTSEFPFNIEANVIGADALTTADPAPDLVVNCIEQLTQLSDYRGAHSSGFAGEVDALKAQVDSTQLPVINVIYRAAAQSQVSSLQIAAGLSSSPFCRYPSFNCALAASDDNNALNRMLELLLNDAPLQSLYPDFSAKMSAAVRPAVASSPRQQGSFS